MVIKQSKTAAPLRFFVEGALEGLLAKIAKRKESQKLHSLSLLTNNRGTALSKQVLRNAFEKARAKSSKAASKAGNEQLAVEIAAFWFYDLRAKAADDVAEKRGEQAAATQLSHTSLSTIKRHYLRRGAKVQATK